MTTNTSINSEKTSLLTLYHYPGIGAKSFQLLFQQFESATEILELAQKDQKQTFIQAGIPNRIIKALCTSSNIDLSADLKWQASSEHHHILTWNDPEYPRRLLDIPTPPPILYINGQVSVLSDPQIAIVGSRTPTRNGSELAYEFANHLGKTGFCITSGLALGIDGEAHKGAVSANAPTIAVTATGLDRVYPARHRELAHQITQTGAIVSEFPIGTSVRSQHFPQRNRIISGLSIGTLVVEAAIQSGSLLTAKYALEQAREVFAIPGSIHNPLTKGCHHLIRQGAKLVENADHIIEEITHLIELPNTNTILEAHSGSEHKQATNTNKNIILDEEYQQLLNTMEYEPITVDQIILQTGLTAETISSMLLMLELQGYVASNGGGAYTRLR